MPGRFNKQLRFSFNPILIQTYSFPAKLRQSKAQKCLLFHLFSAYCEAEQEHILNYFSIKLDFLLMN